MSLLLPGTSIVYYGDEIGSKLQNTPYCDQRTSILSYSYGKYEAHSIASVSLSNEKVQRVHFDFLLIEFPVTTGDPAEEISFEETQDPYAKPPYANPTNYYKHSRDPNRTPMQV